MTDEAMESREHPDGMVDTTDEQPDSRPTGRDDADIRPGGPVSDAPPVGSEESDIAPAGGGTRSDHAGSAPQAGGAASETGPAPTSGEGDVRTGDDPQTEWLREAPGGADRAEG
jgi:hypothetical protein